MTQSGLKEPGQAYIVFVVLEHVEGRSLVNLLISMQKIQIVIVLKSKLVCRKTGLGEDRGRH